MGSGGLKRLRYIIYWLHEHFWAYNGWKGDTAIGDDHYDYTMVYYDNLTASQRNISMLNANQLLYDRDRGIMALLPVTTRKDLYDRTRGDPVVKFLTLFRIS
jgi:hypothetical protein